MLIPSKHSGYIAGIRLYPGGGKGSSAPPPDPRLIDAQLKSMGLQDKGIEMMMANNAEIAPLQKQQLQQSIKFADEDRAYTTERRGVLTGFQDKAVADAKGFNEEGKASEYIGKANADLNSGYAAGMDANRRSLEQRGGSIYGGRMASMANSMALGRSAAQADVGSKMRAAAKAEGLALNDRASNMLAGFPAMSLGTSGTGMNYANAGLAGMNAGWGSAASAAGGMGQNATSMWGAQANYKNQQDQIAASNDPFNTILGAATGGAMAYFTGGLSAAGAKKSG